MFNIGDLITLKNPVGPWSDGDEVSIIDREYKKDYSKFAYYITDEYGDEEIPIDYTYIEIDKVDFLGTKYDLGQVVKFKIKDIDQLKAEGWQDNKKGHLVNKNAYYKFTKQKRRTFNEVRQGIICENPNGKTCIRDPRDGWNYDESMINFIIPVPQTKFKPFRKGIAGITFQGNGDGKLYIGGNYSLNSKQVNELLRELLVFKDWIIE